MQQQPSREDGARRGRLPQPLRSQGGVLAAVAGTTSAGTETVLLVGSSATGAVSGTTLQGGVKVLVLYRGVQGYPDGGP